MMNDYMQYNGSSLYGNYRTRTFSDIFESAEVFTEELNSSPIGVALNKYKEFSKYSSLLFYILYANYGNSNIASSDEDRFKYKLFTTIFQYGPTWAKELTIQKEIHDADIEEFMKGSRQVFNTANNPSVAPSTNTLDELPYINQQSVNRFERSKAEAYNLVLSLLKKDVTAEFVDRFKKLFITIVEPESPLWYTDYSEET